MKFDPPLLTEGPLTGAVYVVTHGKVLDGGIVESSAKYDVTDQFEALALKRGHAITRPEEPSRPSWAEQFKAMSQEDRLLTIAEDGSTLDALIDEALRCRRSEDWRIR